MGPGGRFGLWLLLGTLCPSPRRALDLCSPPPPCDSAHCWCPPGFRGPPWAKDGPCMATAQCDDINECLEGPPRCPPGQSCRNIQGGFLCQCNEGYREVPPPGTPGMGTAPPGTPPSTGDPLKPPRIYCEDIDECSEGLRNCSGGTFCFNTPGGAECHCPPGMDPPGHRTPGPGGCRAVPVPPEICPEEQADCELGETLTRLSGRLRGGGDPLLILQELLALLEGALGGSGEDLGAPPGRHRRVSALLGALEGLGRGAGGLLPPGTVTNVTAGAAALSLAVFRGPPPAPVTLGVPEVQLEVPPEVALDGDSGLSLVALLTHPGVPGALSGAPPVRWGGWGSLPPPSPPRRGRRVPSQRVLSRVGTAFVTRDRDGPHPPGTPPVTLRFQHPPPDPKLGGRVLCAFWDPRELRWDTGGCREVPPENGTPPSPPGGTVCACDHLTSFAVLLAFHEIQEHWLLDLVTQVALGVSLVALGVSVATFSLCRALGGLRTTLHLNLSLSLLVGQGTFLLGIHSTHSPLLCRAVAVLLHWSFLAAFSWMLLEGLHLLVLLVRVFPPPWLRPRLLLLGGFGAPALVVAAAAAAFPGGFGTPQYCWLSLERGFRWSFQGPVIVVIAVNAVVLVVTVWKLVEKFQEVTPDMGHLRRVRVLVVTALGQLCLLGTGWALGLGGGLGWAGGGGPPLPPGSPPPPLPLLFCALNASQGLFIFLCHCLAHPKVRDWYRSLLCPRSRPYSEFTSNTSNTSNTRVPRPPPEA